MKSLLIGLVFLSLSCVATLMFSFMGGASASPDAATLISLQQFTFIPAVLIVFLCFASTARNAGFADGLRLLWRHMPGCLVFAGGLAISLTLLGEIAWAMVRYSAPSLVGSFNHASLVCLGVSSLAFMVLFATLHRMRGYPEYCKARW